jgi:hypothetical protein
MKVFREVKKGGAMKRVIMLAMVLMMMLASIGCWPWWYEDGRGGRSGGHDRGGEHDRDQRHEQRR